ncbi:lytic transglycosylase domain-containing protein [Desmospora profundinema]|uniref:Membrane-bound lytic murein transglycosylase B n=1 Tax=Desmospora profundinema TaxID=1571184 RepID=A0ABU1IJH9_9BACL|nr:lytic transglycosylase domain-containing protein [Desmospora profundinema]MDR6224841.1 membrane-bound lytic murein transglycosylase B [Desmospora profundinema]
MRPSRRKRKTDFLPLILALALFAFFMLKFPDQTENDRIGGSLSEQGKREIPEEYIPVYQAAEKEYGVPWQLLAAVHRVETRFSTMDPMISPVGAKGHFQFMDCTWLGWNYHRCGGLGSLPDGEKVDITDPALIARYGGYGVDATGNGKADPWDLKDAAFSAANYLSDHGAADGDLERALFQYNRSNAYVREVMRYTEAYSGDMNLANEP